MMKTKKALGVLGLLTTMGMALLSAGCIVRTGGGGGGAQAPTQGVAGSGQRTAFEIQNRSGESICYVHISPTTDSNWGPDRLGASEVIGSGVNRAWTLPVGNYDFRFQDCQHRTMMERRGVGIGPSGLSVTYRVRE